MSRVRILLAVLATMLSAGGSVRADGAHSSASSASSAPRATDDLGAREAPREGSHDARKSSRPLPPAGLTVTFPYQQRRLLYSRDGHGGLAYVTSGAPRGARLPVVVFLHGMNADEQVHPWFGPPYGDLRLVVDPLVAAGRVAPFVLAAPTHTRFATGATVMWPRFDLADFLDATEASLGGVAHVDRTRVVLVGHSGAGCNPEGGILGEGIWGARPMAVLAVDTCIGPRVGAELAALSERSSLRLFWQSSWPRPVADLAETCPLCRVEEITDLPGVPHVAILPESLRRVLPELLPP